MGWQRRSGNATSVHQMEFSFEWYLSLLFDRNLKQLARQHRI
jgi:hypothetical protein